MIIRAPNAAKFTVSLLFYVLVLFYGSYICNVRQLRVCCSSWRELNSCLNTVMPICKMKSCLNLNRWSKLAKTSINFTFTSVPTILLFQFITSSRIISPSQAKFYCIFVNSVCLVNKAILSIDVYNRDDRDIWYQSRIYNRGEQEGNTVFNCLDHWPVYTLDWTRGWFTRYQSEAILLRTCVDLSLT